MKINSNGRNKFAPVGRKCRAIGEGYILGSRQEANALVSTIAYADVESRMWVFCF